jgi:hypothetical protein
MNIAFHSNQLGVRGTEIALYDYAYYNREYLGNTSIIISNQNSELTSLAKFREQFKVVLYDQFAETQKIVSSNNIDMIYLIKSGANDGLLVPGIKNVIHSVFQYRQPHGDVYAYVSRWLSQKASNGELPYVPHMIDILRQNHELNYRKFLNIDGEATVFGYYGGPTSFNIPFARRAVVDVALRNKNIYFIFINSERFCDIANVLFLEPTYDLHAKVGFINTCNACIHGRDGGESFGLTLGEFSVKNKPIITTSYCSGGLCDEAHLDILGEKALIYNSYEELVYLLEHFREIVDPSLDWNCYREYLPLQVMDKFREVFIK